MKQLSLKKILTLNCLCISMAILSACQVQQGNNSQQTKNPEAKMGWKLGSQAYTFKEYSFAEAVDKIDSCKLRFVEAYPGQTIGGGIPGNMGPDMDASTRQAVRELLKRKNVRLMAFGVTGADSEADWIKLFEFAKSMGIQTITSEPNERFLPFISTLCDKYKINLAIHNHPKPSQYWSPDIILKALEGHSKRLGACADIGHWVRSGLDPVEALKTLEGRIFHLHMKDLNERAREAHDVHWGEGVSNIPGVIEELKRQNFKGGISAEYEYNWKANSKDVAASVVNFRRMISSKK